MRQNKQAGMTLIELTVVLLVLVALAGLAIPYVSGTSRKALCDATDVSMANIKRVIMEGYYLDTLGHYPQDLSVLSANTGSEKYQLHFLFSKTSLGGRVHKSFDPDSAIGWRTGGYLQDAQVLGADLTTGRYDNATYTEPFLSGHHVVMDAWGRPFVIQVVGEAVCTDSTKWNMDTTETVCARIVSAGAGSGLGEGKAQLDTKITGKPANDDRVLYLNVSTPSADINPSCAD